MKKRLCIYLLLCLAVAGTVCVLRFPKVTSGVWSSTLSWLSIKRAIFAGWMNGEPSYQGKPSSYWARGWHEDQQDLGFDAGKVLTEGGHDAIPVLVALLHDPSVFARNQARTALEQMEPPPVDAVPGIIEAMHTEADERILYVERTLLEKLNHAAIKAAVLDIMHTNPNPTGRHWAIKTVLQLAQDKVYPDSGQYRSPDALDAVRESLKDQAALVQIEAADVLLQLNKDTEHTVPVLTEIVRSGGNATSSEETTQYRGLAIPLLMRIGKPAKSSGPALLVSLKDDNPWVRGVSASALARVDALDENTVPALAAAVRDPDKNVRRNAAQALAAAGPAAKIAIPTVSEGLKDEDPEVREAAANVLGAIGSEASQAVPALVARLKDEDNSVRVAVARALVKIDPTQKAAVMPALHAGAKDEDAQLRLTAAQALWSLDHSDPTLVQVLPEVLKENNRGVRRAALGALRDLGPKSKDVVFALSQQLSGAKPAERIRAAQALSAIGSAARDAVPALETAAKDKDEALRTAALSALERVKAEPAPQAGTSPRPQRGRISP
jgi:HEAT repeat protein